MQGLAQFVLRSGAEMTHTLHSLTDLQTRTSKKKTVLLARDGTHFLESALKKWSGASVIRMARITVSITLIIQNIVS